MRKSTRKTVSTKKPLTPRQQLAIDRRVAEREFEKAMLRIRDSLQNFDENYRTKAAHALSVILYGGPLFAVACAKAQIWRTWPCNSNDPGLWPFIDAENLQFSRVVPADVVTRWNAPDYHVPAELQQKAAE